MKIYWLLIFLLPIQFCYSQEKFLSVLGKSSISIEAESYELRFMVQTRRHNGDILENKLSTIDELKSIINSFDAEYVFYEIPQEEHHSVITQKYVFETKDRKIYQQLHSILEESKIDIFSRYYKYPPKDEAVEEDLMINTLMDARNKAVELANKNAFDLGEIVGINDTYTTKFPDEGFEFHDDFKIKYYGEIFKIRDRYNQYSVNPKQDLSYSVWITYELKRK